MRQPPQDSCSLNEVYHFRASGSGPPRSYEFARSNVVPAFETVTIK